MLMDLSSLGKYLIKYIHLFFTSKDLIKRGSGAFVFYFRFLILSTGDLYFNYIKGVKLSDELLCLYSGVCRQISVCWLY